jgi:hypothetical protein
MESEAWRDVHAIQAIPQEWLPGDMRAISGTNIHFPLR